MFNALSQRISHTSFNTQSENTLSSKRSAEQWHEQFAAAPRAPTPQPMLRAATTDSRLNTYLAPASSQPLLLPLNAVSQTESKSLNPTNYQLTSFGINTSVSINPIMMQIGGRSLLTLNSNRETSNANNTHSPPCVLLPSVALGAMISSSQQHSIKTHLATIPEKDAVPDNQVRLLAKTRKQYPSLKQLSIPSQKVVDTTVARVNSKSQKDMIRSVAVINNEGAQMQDFILSDERSIPETITLSSQQAQPEATPVLANTPRTRRLSRESLISAMSDAVLESVNSKNSVSINRNTTTTEEATRGDLETMSINTGDIIAAAQVLANGAYESPDNSRNNSKTPSTVSRSSAKRSFTSTPDKGALIISGEETNNSTIGTKVPASITLSTDVFELNCELSVSSDDFGFEVLSEHCNQNSQQTIKRNTAERGWEML